MKAIEVIKKYDPCQGVINWLGDRTIEEMVNECERGDWLLWLAKHAGVDLKKITLAKGLCAKQVKHLMTDQRSRDAVDAAISFGKEELSREELDAAANAAEAACSDTYSAVHSSPHVPSGAFSRIAAANAAAEAVYLSDSYSAGVTATSVADAVYFDRSKSPVVSAVITLAAMKEHKRSLKISAYICREVFGKELIELLKTK